MGLPPISVLLEPAACFPAWHLAYQQYGGGGGTITSGCATIEGMVQCDPAVMAKGAGAKIGRAVPLEVYTLARYIASEVGSGTVEEKIAVGQCALNRVAYVEHLPNVMSLLLYRSGNTAYGPIHYTPPGGSRTSPYSRWASTSKDPSYKDLVVAFALFQGMFAGFNKGADDQNGPNGLKDPVGKVLSQAQSRNYWVGPLPGVDPWHTFQYRHLKNVAPDSQLGQILITRGVAAMKSPRPNWTGFPVCERRRIDILPTVALLAGGTLIGFLATGLFARRSLHGIA